MSWTMNKKDVRQIEKLFRDPIVLPSLQGVTQLRKGHNQIPLVQEIFLPSIFMTIAQDSPRTMTLMVGTMVGGDE